MSEVEARMCAAEGLAKAAGVSIERWLDILPAEEASKHEDVRKRLIARERLTNEAEQVWNQLGYDLFWNPLNRRHKPEPPKEPTESEAWAMRRKAAYEAPLYILGNGMIID